jgi:AcrR family transcriptional regulator
MPTSAKAAKRSYESPRRRAMQADTRLAVIAAATKLFTERGWATSVRDIAREAGVAVETVYSAVGSKRELLKVAIDVGLVGDDEPVALAARPVFATLGEGDRESRLASAAAMMADQYTRVAALHHALDQGADGDPELAELQRDVHAQQLTTFTEGLALAVGRRLDPELIDGLQAVSSPAVFLHLIRKSGWTTEQYQKWLAQTLLQLVAHIPEESA